MAEGCCCCCQADHGEHVPYSIPLDSIRFDEERVLKKGLEQNYGICSVRFDFFAGEVIIEYNPKNITTEEIDRALSMPGFVLEANFKRWVGGIVEKHGGRLRLISSGILVLLSWVMLLVLRSDYAFPSPPYIAINLLAIVASGWPTLQGALKAARDQRLNVHVLIAIAVLGAVLLFNWLEAATVLFITVVGEALERAVLNRSETEVVVASVLGARHALVKEGGSLFEVPIHKVVPGQIISVQQGMNIPVDGIVVSGSAQVNEATLTGESAFRPKSSGEKVFAGTIVESGAFEMEAVSVGRETAVANIARMVERARKNKTEWEKTVDRFARYFIPVILALGFIVFALNFFFFDVGLVEAVERGVTILVVACPCALVLATPTAISAGVGKAAKLGVLIKDGNVMEQLGRITSLLMDKTGTLTYGRPTVVDLKSFRDFSEEDALASAVLVEHQSQHPIARTICRYAKDRGVGYGEVDRFMEFEGGGACAKKGDRLIKVGAKWLIDDGREFPEEVLRWIEESEREGFSAVLVADDQDIIGGFRVTDDIREDARNVLDGLRQKGIERIIMVTGDIAAAARRVAQSLGIQEVYSECMPDTKLKKLDEVRREGSVVGMVGDGINDAPALAAADVGIAMGVMGSDAAIAASDVSLMSQDLRSLGLAYSLSRKVLSTIRWNIFFAVTVNFVMVWLASLGHVNMLLGALFHQVSALVVILNSYSLLIRDAG